MQTINLLGMHLQLLPEKAVYIECLDSLLVADVHLGKPETFQKFGVPISALVNQTTLDRLSDLCTQIKPQRLMILGDLFHSKFSITDELLERWQHFLATSQVEVNLIVGNHDRALFSSLDLLSITYFQEAIQIENVILSHDPQPQKHCVNICGHIHPCIRINTKLDNLRLPCFYVKKSQNLLILPSFGEFTGSYEVKLEPTSTAYVIVDDTVVSLTP